MTEEQKPITEPEAPAEPSVEDLFPIEHFHDTIILTLRQVVNNRLVQLEIFGSQKMMWLVKGNGPHEVMLTQGNPILIDGHDILWPLFVSREEHRQRAIGHAQAEAAKAKAEALEKALQADKEKAEAEAEAAAKALEDGAPKRKGLLTWLRGGSR